MTQARHVAAHPPDFLDALSQDDWNRVLMAGAVLVMALVSSAGGSKLLLLVLIACFVLSTRKPGNNAFEVMFERWFKADLYPQLSHKLTRELDERSQRPGQSLFSSLKDSAQSFLLDKTTGVRAELAWTAFASTQLRVRYRDFGFFRTACVNMNGSSTTANPVHVVFVGINQEWYLSPHIKLDFDQVSVLQMMEGN